MMRNSNIFKSHAARIIRTVLAFTLCSALLVSPISGINAEAKKAPKKSSIQSKTVVSEPNEVSIAEVSALQLINNERSKAGCNALTWSNDLAAAANVRAVEIVQNFSHTRPDGTDYWTVNSNVVYGENLARLYQSANDAIDNLMKSKAHRSNFLCSEYRTIGIAISPDSKGQWYWAFELGY